MMSYPASDCDTFVASTMAAPTEFSRDSLAWSECDDEPYCLDYADEPYDADEPSPRWAWVLGRKSGNRLVLVHNLDKCTHSIQRELRRHDDHVARIHWMCSAFQRKLRPVVAGWRGSTTSEMPVQMGVRERVSQLNHLPVTLICERCLHPITELLRQFSHEIVGTGR